MEIKMSEASLWNLLHADRVKIEPSDVGSFYLTAYLSCKKTYITNAEFPINFPSVEDAVILASKVRPDLPVTTWSRGTWGK